MSCLAQALFFYDLAAPLLSRLSKLPRRPPHDRPCGSAAQDRERHRRRGLLCQPLTESNRYNLWVVASTVTAAGAGAVAAAGAAAGVSVDRIAHLLIEQGKNGV